MSSRHTASAVALLALVSGAGVGTAAAAVPAVHPSTVHAAAAHAGWFRDPVSASQRRHEVAAHPSSIGALRHTTATFRSHEGSLAVPTSEVSGHQLTAGESVLLGMAALFPFNSATPTAAARHAVERLAGSTDLVRSATCEGYADFGGSESHEQSLSAHRAAAICSLLHKDADVTTHSVGYGSSRPVVIGGLRSERAANRRVVISVASSRTASAAPSVTRAKAASHSAVLTFDAVKRVDGKTVTRYQYSLDGGQTWHRLTVRGSGATLEGVLTGLTNGHTYHVAIRAVSSAGTSPVSNSVTVRPTASGSSSGTTVAGAPALISATPGDSSATVRFTAPSDTGGSRITGYQVSTDGGQTFTTVATSGSSPYTATLTGLTNGTTYTVEVRAVNANGDSVASNSLQVTPEAASGAQPSATVPGPVQNLSATADDTQSGEFYADLSFDAPASGGTPTSYEYSVDGGSTYQTFTTSGSSPITGSVDTGQNDCDSSQTITIYVRAVDAAGAGPGASTTLYLAEDC